MPKVKAGFSEGRPFYGSNTTKNYEQTGRDGTLAKNSQKRDMSECKRKSKKLENSSLNGNCVYDSRAKSKMGFPKQKHIPVPIIPIKIKTPPKTKNTEVKRKQEIICATWNIKKGLISREGELKNLLNSEKIDIIFITETDTKNINSAEDFQIDGYKTIMPLNHGVGTNI